MSSVTPGRFVLVCLLCAVVVSWLLLMPGGDGFGEEGKARPSDDVSTTQWPIAVVDLAAVLENLPQFRNEQMALRMDVERARSHFQERQNVLVQQQQDLQKLSPDTADYKEKIAALQQQIGQLQTEFQLQQQEFYNRERQLLLGAYKQVERVVEEIARERGLMLVLRTTREPIGGNPQELIGYLGKEVIWAESRIDITKDVIGRIRGSQPKD